MCNGSPFQKNYNFKMAILLKITIELFYKYLDTGQGTNFSEQLFFSMTSVALETPFHLE